MHLSVIFFMMTLYWCSISGAAWASWLIKSPTTRLFDQQRDHADIKGNIKAPHYWPSKIQRWLVDSRPKGPVIQKAFPCHDATLDNAWSQITDKRPHWCSNSLMMTSSDGNIFRVTGHLCGEFTGHRWIPRKKASDAELWCFLSAPG